ncbi:hypothetical protein L6252_04035 [Candidatus Parcubacteria bacterium]|nr:hypothetical protein [Candidatus Parcubacteria bacterium]
MAKKYSETTKKVLLGVAMVGVVAIAATSPYFLLGIAKEIIKNNKKKSFQKLNKQKAQEEEKKIAKTIARLNKNKLVILSKENGLLRVKLSEKGLRKVKEIEFDGMEIQKPKHWDKKWRLVTFDIPDTTKRPARDALRKKLKKLNFYPLQKSVFIHPYPCEKEIQILCELFEIWPYVNILLVEKIFNDEEVKKYFNL